MQRQFRCNIIFPLYRILCHLISTITTQVMQTYGGWQLLLQSSRLLSVVMLETFFSNVTTVVPPCNTAAPYTSGGTMYFNSPPVYPQHVPHFVNYTKTGYQPVNEDYAPPSAYRTKVVHRIDLSPLVNWRSY